MTKYPPAYLPIRQHGYDQEQGDLCFIEKLLKPSKYSWSATHVCDRCNAATSMDDIIPSFDDNKMLLCRVCKKCFATARDRRPLQRMRAFGLCTTYICPFCNKWDRYDDAIIQHITHVHLRPQEYVGYNREKLFMCPCETCPWSSEQLALPPKEMRRHIWTNHIVPLLASYQPKDQVLDMLNDEYDARLEEERKQLRERVAAENAAAVEAARAEQTNGGPTLIRTQPTTAGATAHGPVPTGHRGIPPPPGFEGDENIFDDALSRALASLMFHAVLSGRGHPFLRFGLPGDEEDDDDEYEDVDEDEESGQAGSSGADQPSSGSGAGSSSASS